MARYVSWLCVALLVSLQVVVTAAGERAASAGVCRSGDGKCSSDHLLLQVHGDLPAREGLAKSVEKRTPTDAESADEYGEEKVLTDAPDVNAESGASVWAIPDSVEARREKQADAGEEVDQDEPGTIVTNFGGLLHVSAFFWNTHWQCSMGQRGASRNCRSKAVDRFVALAKQSQANIIASVELSYGMSTPVHLNHHGLDGWSQVQGPCQKGANGDCVALGFAPGWKVIQAGGGCLRRDWDTRAFAVALVEPPMPVKDCRALCVVAIHAPHSEIDNGADEVRRVCGETTNQCAMALGDWNVPAYSVKDLWAKLIGGNEPHISHPNERSCCWPESHHYGFFDHIATNIPQSQQGEFHMFDYQILEENPVEQHRPVNVHLHLPGGMQMAL